MSKPCMRTNAAFLLAARLDVISNDFYPAKLAISKRVMWPKATKKKRGK